VKRPRRRSLIAASVILVVAVLAVAAVLVHSGGAPGSTRTAAGTPADLAQGADPGPLAPFAVPGGGTVHLPASWPHLPPQGGDIAVVAYAPPGSAAAGSTMTIRAGTANALPLSRTVAIFEDLQASLHPGWHLLLQVPQQIPGMTAAELVVARYDTAANGVNTAEDLIAHNGSGRAWHISVLGPKATIGSRFLNSATLSLRLQ
jgi:hypothetical protein